MVDFIIDIFFLLTNYIFKFYKMKEKNRTEKLVQKMTSFTNGEKKFLLPVEKFYNGHRKIGWMKLVTDSTISNTKNKTQYALCEYLCIFAFMKYLFETQ